MVVNDFIDYEYSEYQIRIIYKIFYKSRWCNKHIDKNALFDGIPCHDLKTAKKSLKDLVKMGLIQEYPSQNRKDYCINKKYMKSIIIILKKYANEYPFIIHLSGINIE